VYPEGVEEEGVKVCTSCSSTAIFPHAILQNIKRPRHTESGISDILQQARYEYHSFEGSVYETLLSH
jgi:hypothetical protein